MCLGARELRLREQSVIEWESIAAIGMKSAVSHSVDVVDDLDVKSGNALSKRHLNREGIRPEGKRGVSVHDVAGSECWNVVANSARLGRCACHSSSRVNVKLDGAVGVGGDSTDNLWRTLLVNLILCVICEEKITNSDVASQAHRSVRVDGSK